MALQRVLEALDLLDGWVTGDEVAEELRARGLEVETTEVAGDDGATTFLRVVVPGAAGRVNGGEARTTGIIGRLGGIGARPHAVGMVSDADGAVAAVAIACKLAAMQREGDVLPGDVIVTTHICPDAPTRPHLPVDFMDSPVSIEEMNAREVSAEMDAVLSIDTTKGNRVLNHRGIAISPTVREGWILKVAPDLLRILETTTGVAPRTFPITMQDITPYGNGVDHINSILQPATATTAPVVGVAIAAESVVPGCGTGASHEVDIAEAVRFAIEVAKEVGGGTCRFHDEAEWGRLVSLYGRMAHLQGRPG